MVLKERHQGSLLEMNKYDHKANDMVEGAITLVVDLSKAFEKAQLVVVCNWAMHCGFPQRILRVLRGYFEHHR